jgi:hypothetical protein
MIYHLEDKPKSGAHRKDGFAWRYAARCGETFLGGEQEHTLADPNVAPTCPICHLHTLPSHDLADLAVEALCILSARDDATEIRLAEVRRIGRISG